jgi:hypothetical protein
VLRKKRNDQYAFHWRRDPEKEQYWRRLIAKFNASGKSVRIFAAEVGISEASFYFWRKELKLRDCDVVGVDDEARWEDNASVLPVAPDGNGLEQRLKSPTNPFVPLRLLSERGAPESPSPAPMARVGSVVTVTTPAGYSISLASDCDLQLLGQVLLILEGRKC